MKKLFIAGALSAGLLMLASSFTQAAAISGQGTWETTLQGRDLDGNLATAEAYYDTVLGITWLGDANYAGTTMNWVAANTWAASLNPYGSGITGWRLPMTIDKGAPGCNSGNTGSTDCGLNVDTTTSEMASMYYDTLGPAEHAGPFTNIKPWAYWSATEYAPYTDYAWFFTMDIGYQSSYKKSMRYFTWAVHDGDVGAATVPIPAAIWLFGSGLLGLGAVARKRQR